MSDDKSNVDVLRLMGMKFYGYHGAIPEEEKLGGHYTVDLEIIGDFSYDKTNDELAKTVDMEEVFRITEEIVCERRFNLIETLADEIAEVVLDKFVIDEIIVTVRKESPPIPGAVSAMEAIITRSR